MKKILILTLCIAAFLLLFSCGSKSKKNQAAENTVAAENILPIDTHNARNSLDFMGAYRGTLPTASGEGMDVRIVLQDSTYTKEVLYIGKAEEPIVSIGTFSWNEAGNTITLNEEEKPNQYFVAENMLIQLDINGNRIEGELAEKYILKRE